MKEFLTVSHIFRSGDTAPLTLLECVIGIYMNEFTNKEQEIYYFTRLNRVQYKNICTRTWNCSALMWYFTKWSAPVLVSFCTRLSRFRSERTAKLIIFVSFLACFFTNSFLLISISSKVDEKEKKWRTSGCSVNNLWKKWRNKNDI